MHLKFKSDDYATYKGFQADWRAVEWIYLPNKNEVHISKDDIIRILNIYVNKTISICL